SSPYRLPSALEPAGSEFRQQTACRSKRPEISANRRTKGSAPSSPAGDKGPDPLVLQPGSLKLDLRRFLGPRRRLEVGLFLKLRKEAGNDHRRKCVAFRIERLGRFIKPHAFNRNPIF